MLLFFFNTIGDVKNSMLIVSFLVSEFFRVRKLLIVSPVFA